MSSPPETISTIPAIPATIIIGEGPLPSAGTGFAGAEDASVFERRLGPGTREASDKDRSKRKVSFQKFQELIFRKSRRFDDCTECCTVKFIMQRDSNIKGSVRLLLFHPDMTFLSGVRMRIPPGLIPGLHRCRIVPGDASHRNLDDPCTFFRDDILIWFKVQGDRFSDILFCLPDCPSL